MNHFNPKSLAFYGGAIAAVVALFSAVTSYGETRLKAPAKIDGRYSLTFNTSSACLKSTPLLLTIQQSGVYLSGTLTTNQPGAKSVNAPEEKPTLTGEWQRGGQQFSLTGLDSQRVLCSVPATPANSAIPNPAPQVTIQARLEATSSSEKTLTGQMILNSVAPAIEFTAQLQAIAEQPAAH